MPIFTYGPYGYEHYFAAYALYPEVMERHFSLQADYAVMYNVAAARAIREGGLPPLIRLDQDLTDSRGTLVSIESMERLWFPHLARCIEPLLHADVTLIWHCDGNITPMVGPLLDAGIGGFQGFQYEDGVDYPSICGMRARDGADLLIIGGVSVTRTLPFGTPEDVRKEMRWLVENGPRRLFLGASSSIAPGVPEANLRAMVEGFHYYRERGRG
jgi:uroporphyrinogen decarboxylase